VEKENKEAYIKGKEKGKFWLTEGPKQKDSNIGRGKMLNTRRKGTKTEEKRKKMRVQRTKENMVICVK
jgi:hypothetical protein